MATWAEVQVEVDKKLSGVPDEEVAKRVKEVLKKAVDVWPLLGQNELRGQVEMNIQAYKKLRVEEEKISAEKNKMRKVADQKLRDMATGFADALGFKVGGWVEVTPEGTDYHNSWSTSTVDGLYKIGAINTFGSVNWVTYGGIDEVKISKSSYITVEGDTHRFPAFRIDLTPYNVLTGKPMTRKQRGHHSRVNEVDVIYYQVTSMKNLAGLRLLSEEQAQERLTSGKQKVAEKAKEKAKLAKDLVKDITGGMTPEQILKLTEMAKAIKTGGGK